MLSHTLNCDLKEEGEIEGKLVDFYFPGSEVQWITELETWGVRGMQRTSPSPRLGYALSPCPFMYRPILLSF